MSGYVSNKITLDDAEACWLHGFKIYKRDSLPYTRSSDGVEVNSLTMDDVMYVSPELYDELIGRIEEMSDGGV